MGFCTYTFQYNKHHTVSQYIHRASVCVWFHFQILWENSIEVRLCFTLQIKQRVKHLSSPNKGTGEIFKLFERIRKSYGINNIYITSEWRPAMLKDKRCFFTLTSRRSICFAFFTHWSTTTNKLDKTAFLMGRLSIPSSNFLIYFFSFSSIFIYLCYRSGFGLPWQISFRFLLFYFNKPAPNDCLHGNYRSLFLPYSLCVHKWNDSAAVLQINFIVIDVICHPQKMSRKYQQTILVSYLENSTNTVIKKKKDKYSWCFKFPTTI